MVSLPPETTFSGKARRDSPTGARYAPPTPMAKNKKGTSVEKRRREREKQLKRMEKEERRLQRKEDKLRSKEDPNYQPEMEDPRDFYLEQDEEEEPKDRDENRADPSL